jgi:hypothetical protein
MKRELRLEINLDVDVKQTDEEIAESLKKLIQRNSDSHRLYVQSVLVVKGSKSPAGKLIG